jgi:hypothetical protein
MPNQADIPNEAPPSYSQATGSSAGASSSSRPHAQDTGHLAIPGSSGNDTKIPATYRRSMEDEQRPLPPGWVRTFDPKTKHQFFVDTTKDPPRSIWVHPYVPRSHAKIEPKKHQLTIDESGRYDDEQYLRTLSSEERERIEEESPGLGRGHPPSKADIVSAHTDDEASDDDHAATGGASSSSQRPPAELPPRPDDKGKKSFGRKLKDKVTGTTHEQRVQERQKRAEEEQRAYEQHMHVRQCMARAAETGQPQLVGKDRDGKDVYVEPPAYQGNYGYGGGYGYDPYGQGGVYTTPNARYIRPAAPYGRPYGMGVLAQRCVDMS